MVRGIQHREKNEALYYFVITPQAAILLYKRNSPYAPVSPSDIARLNELSSDDKEILAHFAHGPTLVHTLPKLFLALEHTALPIAYSAWDFQKGNILKLSQKIKLDLELTMRRVITARGSQESFMLNLKSLPAATHAERPLLVRGDHALFFGEQTLSLHQFADPLATLLSRIRRAPSFPFSGGDKTPLLQTPIEGVFLGQLQNLIDQLKERAHLTLDQALAKLTIAGAPSLTLTAIHDVDPILGERLSITPHLDWGHVREDISATYYRSTAGGKVHIARRAAHAHYITEQNGKLILTLVDSSRAEHFYKLLFLNAKQLGLSASLECRLSGEKRISTYFRETWPEVLAFAHKHGITVTLNNNTLSDEHALFRADFAVEMNAESDELSFDVACYIGDQRISIETLRSFVESGSSHLMLENGTSVQIDNSGELARFIRMLRSFRSREESFVGKLHHAPELKYIMTCSPHYNSRCADSFKQFTEQAEHGTPMKPPVIPEHLEPILRPYQKEGIAWLDFLRSYRFGGILADDMGLGKTLQALAFLSMHRESKKPHLVVCPKTLIYNWACEAAKFTPQMKVVTIDGTASDRAEAHELSQKADLVITSYSALLADKEWHSKATTMYDYVVLDEAQFIKNHASKTAMLVKKLNAEYRLALTGTPLENNVTEIWSIMDFLMPGFLGHHNDFIDRYAKPIMQTNDTFALEQLRRKITVFMLRRTKQEVLKELPPKIEQHAPVALSPDQRILYSEILAQVRNSIESTVEANGFARSYIHILSGLMKLRQVCNHPALLLAENDPMRKEATSSKMDLAIELIDEALAGNSSNDEQPHKVLVFSQFTGMLDLLGAELKAKGTPFITLTGKTQNRQELVEKFNKDKETCVFLISTKAGGTGLNLASADTVIVIDPWWNPSVERQAIDRAHRIGQTRSVNVYKLITTGTIEEKIQALQSKKKDLFDALVNETGSTLSKLTWDDVRSLFAD